MSKIEIDITGLPLRKLSELESKGWVVNGVHIQRVKDDGTFKHGAVTTGGKVLWWQSEQERVIAPGVRELLAQAVELLDDLAAYYPNSYAADTLKKITPAMREALAKPAKCWKCGDTDAAFQAVCDVPACEMREALAAANSPESEGIKTVVQQEPVLFIHPDTFAKASAHVGAWRPGHELPGYIPLYTTLQPAPQQEPDALHMVIIDLARKQSDRIAELESTVAEFKSVGWAISYDGQTPYRMWYEGDGEILDLEVRRLGGTACKIEMFAKVKK